MKYNWAGSGERHDLDLLATMIRPGPAPGPEDLHLAPATRDLE